MNSPIDQGLLSFEAFRAAMTNMDIGGAAGALAREGILKGHDFLMACAVRCADGGEPFYPHPTPSWT